MLCLTLFLLATSRQTNSAVHWTLDPASGITRGRDLSSVAVDASGKRGFAVGASGVVLRWDGTSWSDDADAEKAAPDVWLRSVAINSSGTRAFAVGEGGVVLSWNGKSWKRELRTGKLADGQFLAAVAINPAGTEAWAVGQYGVTLHWKASKWTRESTPIKPPGFVSGGAPVDGEGLYAVWMDPKDGHAITAGFSGLVLRWNGKSWKYDHKIINLRYSADPFGGLTAIHIDQGGKSGWMAGGQSMLKMTNGVWKQTGHNQQWNEEHYIFSLASTADGKTVFAVGSRGEVIRFDGSVWVPDFGAQRDAAKMELMSVCLNSTGNVGFAVGTRGMILRWDGSAWNIDPAATAKVTVKRLAAVATNPSGTFAMAVGDAGETIQWDGSAWKRMASDQDRRWYFSALWISPSDNRVVASATGGILNRERDKWTAQPGVNMQANFRSLAFTSDGTFGFAVGHPAGYVYRYENGAWTEDKEAEALAGLGLNSVALCSDGHLGFIGGGNTFLKWDGKHWSKDAKLSTGYYSSVALSADGKVGFATGGPGQNDLLMRWNGSTWTSEPKVTRKVFTNGPNCVCVSADGKVALAAGYYSGILRWDGHVWTREEAASQLAADQMLVSACLDATGKTGWVIADNGMLLHYHQ